MTMTMTMTMTRRRRRRRRRRRERTMKTTMMRTRMKIRMMTQQHCQESCYPQAPRTVVAAAALAVCVLAPRYAAGYHTVPASPASGCIAAVVECRAWRRIEQPRPLTLQRRVLPHAAPLLTFPPTSPPPRPPGQLASPRWSEKRWLFEGLLSIVSPLSAAWAFSAASELSQP